MVFMEEEGIGKAFTTQHYEPAPYSPAPKKRNKFLPLLLVVIVIALLFFGARQFLSPKTESEIVVTPTPTLMEEEPTPTEEPEASPTPEVTSTPTPKPTQNPVDKATGLDRSDVSVAVQNGSGEKGVANQASDILKNLGYHILSIGNADNFEYENVVIQIKPTKSAYLPLLKNDLDDSYTIGSTSATLSASSSADALVIVGK